MIKQIIKKYPILKEIFLYGIIGALSAGLDSCTYIGLRRMNIKLYTANFISINLGITLSFFLNTYFNFKRTDKICKRAISFYSIGYIGLMLSMLILFIGTNLLQRNETITKLCSVVIVAVFQFVLNKLITFGKR